MKLKIWPFCKDDDDSTEERIIVEDVPLEQVSCDVLKEEIARRKKENHDRRVREANAKADRIDRLIDELCNEMAVDIKTESKSDYQQIIVEKLKNGIEPIISYYGVRTHYHHGDYSNDLYEKIYEDRRRKPTGL